MSFFSDLQAALTTLSAVVGEDVDAGDVSALMQRLSDDRIIEVITIATTLVRGAESLRIAASGAVALRSTRETGHGGLAQKRGHRSPVSLIQDLTGTTRADAAKQVRLGEALVEAGTDGAGTDGADSGVAGTAGDAGIAGDASPRSPESVREQARPWHAPLGDALMRGILTSAQHDAIYRGLGEPPSARTADDGADADATVDSEACAAWSTAAAQLIDEAAVRTVEELAAASRTIRDLLDPDGAHRRFTERFAGRTFRTWVDRDGTRRGSIAFDDEGGEWVTAILAAALRPRRGGPRFVDAEEKARADELAGDPRTNDQLAYDLLIDVLRAGALAEPEAVFGTRRAGIRIVATSDAHAAAVAGRPAVAVGEDSDVALPGWLLAQHACDGGIIPVTVNADGQPLTLGREARLFSAAQRLALAIRDGGCRWRGCDRPASYCESHHIDPWQEGGRTDVDRGILLCRFHHMQLHNGGWRITRDDTGEFLLHGPGTSPPTVLPPRLTRRYAWGDLQPPQRRFRPAA